MPSKPTVASLFSGAGGMDIGFHQAGFDVVWANDIDSDACQTHRNWSSADVVCGDVKSLVPSLMPSVDVITGGFPCQGFSLSGPRKVDDSRNILYRHFVRCVEEKKPKAFVAENVKGLLTLGEGWNR
jgi:DNA (cytosine-5)-methyltransferase 1